MTNWVTPVTVTGQHVRLEPMADVRSRVTRIRRDHPDAPFWYLGYSTGGTLISAFAAYIMINGHSLPLPFMLAWVFFLAVLGVMGTALGFIASLLINANRNADRYAAYGFGVVPDSLEGFLGPLAGVLSALEAIDTAFLLTAPCDSPLLAPGLAACMHASLAREEADLAVAHDGERQQPVFLLLRRGLAADLRDYLAGGGRKIDLWFARHRLAEADLSHRRDSFINVNDPAERQRVEQLLLNRSSAG